MTKKFVGKLFPKINIYFEDKYLSKRTLKNWVIQAIICSIPSCVLVSKLLSRSPVQSVIVFHAYLPPANEVWGKVIFYTCLPFCSQGGGLASMHASLVTWLGGLQPGGIGQTPQVCLRGGAVGQTPPKTHGILRDTVNERAVRILLECILVWNMI